MLERMKPLQELKAREVKIDFMEDVEATERPRVKLLLEIRRYHLA